jgi:C4-dicarboxylate-specific signal transduction histidine kinase
MHLDDDPIPVHGDRVHLQQVVLNLLQNALEATGDRSRPDRVVRLTCRRIDHRARVTVEDSGPGLRPGEEEIVFEPFFTTKGDGMGMGLAIVRSIVEAHGGTVHAANGGQAGGALFEVTLPIVDAGID